LSSTEKYLISIVGPTAIGKTELAIKTANYFSRQQSRFQLRKSGNCATKLLLKFVTGLELISDFRIHRQQF